MLCLVCVCPLLFTSAGLTDSPCARGCWASLCVVLYSLAWMVFLNLGARWDPHLTSDPHLVDYCVVLFSYRYSPGQISDTDL